METITLHRVVEDADLDITIDVPDSWVEFGVVGCVIALTGTLGEPEESMRPSVAVYIDEVDGQEQAFSMVREAFTELPEVDIQVDSTGVRDGMPSLFLGLAFRHPGTEALQVQTVLACYVDGDRPLLVRTTGTCGGGAGEDVMQRLGEIVTSIGITPHDR